MVLVFGYLGLLGEFHLSKYLFKQYCEEKGRTGAFIYEKVALPAAFFVPETQAYKKSVFSDDSFVLDETATINREIFNRYYRVDYYKEKILSKVGPIYSVDTTITRLSDQKVLSKASSLNNKLGWLSRYLSKAFTSNGQTCPSGRKNGRVLFIQEHNDLIKNAFIKR